MPVVARATRHTPRSNINREGCAALRDRGSPISAVVATPAGPMRLR
jgi:hypothetical protein